MRVITGTARGVPLKAPKGMDTRPTMDQVKEGIFSAIQFEVEGRRALDLFAGSGQLGQGAHRRHPGEPEKDKAGRTCYSRAGKLQFLAENLPPAVRSDPSGPALCRSFFGNCPKNRIRN